VILVEFDSDPSQKWREAKSQKYPLTLMEGVLLPRNHLATGIS
jgi:hypothetical protein